MSDFFWVSVFVSSGLVVAAWFSAPRESSRWPLIGMMGIAFFISFAMMVSAVLLLHFLIMAGLMIVWAIFGRKPAVLRTFAIAAPIWPYAWGLSYWYAEHEKLTQLRAEYPITSVAERLAYEKRPTERLGAGSDIAATALAPAVLMALQAQERRQEQDDYRNRLFRNLHTSTYDRFTGSAGFGQARMAGFYPLKPDRKPAESIEQPQPPASPNDGSTPDVAAAVAGKAASSLPPAPQHFMLEILHTDGATQFVDPDRLGYVENREHIVGFEPHRFDSLPQLSGSSGDAWQLARIELVSLLKHPEPRIYVSQHLPRMDELKDAPTRPLDGFEARALPQLRTDRDTVIEESANSVRMLGAVRAGSTCLQCHNVARGDLLGAFSYLLRRTTPILERKPTKREAEL